MSGLDEVKVWLFTVTLWLGTFAYPAPTWFKVVMGFWAFGMFPSWLLPRFGRRY